MLDSGDDLGLGQRLGDFPNMVFLGKVAESIVGRRNSGLIFRDEREHVGLNCIFGALSIVDKMVDGVRSVCMRC